MVESSSIKYSLNPSTSEYRLEIRKYKMKQQFLEWLVYNNQHLDMPHL